MLNKLKQALAIVEESNSLHSEEEYKIEHTILTELISFVQVGCDYERSRCEMVKMFEYGLNSPDCNSHLCKFALTILDTLNARLEALNAN